MKKIIFTLLFLCIPIIVFAEAGPPIPTPKISIQKAIRLSKVYFYKEWKEIFKKAGINIDEYIIKSIEWTNDESQKEWVWKIIFVHPIANDHRVPYEVTNKGEIIEQPMTNRIRTL